MPRGVSHWLAVGLLLAACGGGGGKDAADAGEPDAEPIDPTCGVHIRSVPRIGGPIEDIPVLFHAADGTIIELTYTDAEGMATRQCDGPLSVSVFIEALPIRIMLTYGGVREGHIVVIDEPGDPALPGDPASTIEFTLSTVGQGTADGFDYALGPAGPTCAGATTSGATVTKAIGPSCLGDDPSTVDLLVSAKEGSAIVGFDYAVDIPVVAGGTSAVPALNGFDPNVPVDHQATGIPPGVGQVTVSHTFRKDGINWRFVTDTADLGGTSHTVGLLRLPAGFGARIEHSTEVLYDDNSELEIHSVSAATGDPIAVDFGQSPPRMLGLASLSGDSPQIQILPEGALESDTAILGALGWGELGNAVAWSYVGPIDQTTLVLPEFPDELASFAPTDNFQPGALYAAIAVAGKSFREILADPRFTLRPHNIAPEILEVGEMVFISKTTEVL